MKNKRIFIYLVLVLLIIGIPFINKYPVVNVVGLGVGTIILLALSISDWKNKSDEPLIHANYCLDMSLTNAILYKYSNSLINAIGAVIFIILTLSYLYINYTRGITNEKD